MSIIGQNKRFTIYCLGTLLFAIYIYKGLTYRTEFISTKALAVFSAWVFGQNCDFAVSAIEVVFDDNFVATKAAANRNGVTHKEEKMELKTTIFICAQG